MSMTMIPRYTSSGYECADLCAWTFSSATFPAGGGLANVRWNCNAAAIKQGCTSRYYLIQASHPALFSLPKPESDGMNAGASRFSNLVHAFSQREGTSACAGGLGLSFPVWLQVALQLSH